MGEPASLTATELPQDWATRSDDGKLDWLNKQPMPDDNKVSVGRCVAQSAKVSDYCRAFIELVNAMVSEVHAAHKNTDDIMAKTAKFVDVVASGIWKFNEQLVTDCSTIFNTGKCADDALLLKPAGVSMPRMPDVESSSEPKHNIAGVSSTVVCPCSSQLTLPSKFSSYFETCSRSFAPTAPLSTNFVHRLDLAGLKS